MRFSVIFSVDVPGDRSIRPFVPKGRAWQRTEGDEQYEYGYLEGCWEKGKHRKFCALLTRKQFDRFVSQMSLYASSTETMGSLGAPGCGFGMAPAISFDTGDWDDAILNAYVTPMPDGEPKHPQHWENAEAGERNWQRIRKAVLKVYG
jgi:hypothetical protein